MKSLKTLLGIVIYEQTIAVTDVELVDGSFVVRKSAEYTLPNGVTIENLSSDSAGFKSFLKEQGFKSKKAIIGLSAKHMISTLMRLPRIEDPQIRHETIRINLERKIEVDFSDIVFDYIDQPADESSVLVMMLLKNILISVKELLADLKIRPLRVTSTSLGLDLNTSSDLTCNIIEYPSSLELCVFQKNHLHAVQHVPRNSEQTLNAELAQKITRQVNRICLSSGLTSTVHYCIWGSDCQSRTKDQQIQQLLKNAEYKTVKSLSKSSLCGLSAELAGRQLAGSVNSINFLNGRHEQARPTVLSQWLSKIVIFAAGVLVLIGLFFLDWHSDTRQISDYQQQLDFMQTNVAAAEKMIDQVSYARRWFQKEPICLEILRELTLSFPQNSDIWLTSLAVDESLNQILTGRTVSEDAVLDVVETLQSKNVFDDIKILYIRKTGKGSEILTFAINLRYRKDINHGTDKP